MNEYSELPAESTWVEYLRTRLPYSFSHVCKQRQRKGATQYELSGSLLTKKWAAYHNFWKRGYVYYASGKLIDFHKLPLYWREYHVAHTNELRGRFSGPVDLMSRWPQDVFNALQLESMWAFAADNHLDRERVVMANMTLAIEFCLKAITAHAEYRQTKSFAFTEGHDLTKMFACLPVELRLELQSESVKFAERYAAFRRAIEDRVKQLTRRFGPPHRRPDVEEWERIVSDIGRTNYTAFIGVNDPVSVAALGCEPEEWLGRAMKGIGGITYHRYSPFGGRDDYPVTPIHLGLLLGRFMYEHLFPVRRTASIEGA